MPSDAQIFRSRTNRVLAVVGWVACAAFASALAFVTEPVQLLFLVLPALVALFFWSVFWMPRVEVGDDGTTLVNALRTVRVPWEALIQVETRYALTLRTPKRSYASTAAPAPGSFGTWVANRDVRVPRRNDDRVIEHRRPSDLENTDSGGAAALVLRRWNALIDSGSLAIGEADSTPVEVRWHVPLIAAFAVLIAASVAVLALVR